MRLSGAGHSRAKLQLVAHLFIRSWAWLYTLGLTLEMKHQRRAEIDADIWDHSHASHLYGSTSSVLLRCLRGIPDDLFWRFSGAETSRGPKKEGLAMRQFTMQSKSGRATILLLAALIVATIAFIVPYNSWYNDPARVDMGFSDIVWPWVILGVPLLASGALLTLGGLALARRLPWLGAMLFIAGMWMVALLFYWLTVPFVIAGVASLFAVWRARKLTSRS